MKEESLKGMNGYEISLNQRKTWHEGSEYLGKFYHQFELQLNNSISNESIIDAFFAVAEKSETLGYRAREVKGSIYPEQVGFVSNELDYFTATLKHEDQIRSQANEFLDTEYTISGHSPVRFCILNQDTGDSYLVIRFYAFWMDAFSCITILDELDKALNDLEGYKNDETEKVDYLNFSVWQNDLIAEMEEEAKQFWELYAKSDDGTSYPFGKNDVKTFNAHKTSTCIKGDVYEEVKRAKVVESCEMEDVLMSLFLKYLRTFSDKNITIGYTPFSRSYEELNATTGNVNKTVPLILNSEANNLIAEAKKVRANTLEWSDFFDPIKNDLEEKRKQFDFSFQYIPTTSNRDYNHFSVRNVEQITNKSDIQIVCFDNNDALTVDFVLNAEKFSQDEISLIVEQLKSCFENFGESQTIISDYESELIAALNNNTVDFEVKNSILELLESVANENEDQIAIHDDTTRMTYGELNVESNKFANHISEKYNVQRGDSVAIVLDRSKEFIISVLGVLKTGAFYVPIDTENPKSRIALILEDCAPKLTITTLDIEGDYTLLSPLDSGISEESSEQFKVETNENDIVYAIYTSGSTGKPKGCQISNKNLLNYVQWANRNYFKNNEVGNWALITSIAFDLTITSIFTSLTRGKKLWIGSQKMGITELLEDALLHPEIDTIKLTPSHIELAKSLGVKDANIDVVICGGEQLLRSQVDFLKSINGGMRIFNEYGPTEATVGCIVKEVENEGEILIGKPISNMTIQILNPENKQCLVGEEGEIGIIGVGVMKEYHNLPEITKQKFVKSPLNSAETMYRTGDLGKWLADGNIQYIGRADDQVKIRGYRIELGEIEKYLDQIDGLKSALVTVEKNSENESFLYAYVCADEKIEGIAIREQLQKWLPDYMMPNQFVQVDEFPLTVNGKVDRKALKELRESKCSTIEYVAPESSIEHELVHIWQKLFEIDKVGIRDDFFELGGHSLIATRLIAEYHKTFDIRLKLKDFFDFTTIEAQAGLLMDQEKDNRSVISPAPIMDNYPVSEAQHRLWLSYQLAPQNVTYNMPNSIEINFELDEVSFERAIQLTIERHEILRTVFNSVKDEVRQVIRSVEEFAFRLKIVDVSEQDNPEKNIFDYIQGDTNQPFDLEKGPLLRTCLFKVSEDRFVFYFNMHHIISDGWSMNVLVENVLTFYYALVNDTPAELSPLRIQYKDYAVWERSEESKQSLEEDKAYWLSQFHEEIEPLTLLFSKDRPVVKTSNGQLKKWDVSKSLLDELTTKLGGRSTSMFMKVMGAFGILLHHHSHQSKFVIGSPSTDRQHEELKDQIGFYLNTLAIKLELNAKGSLEEYISHVKSSILKGIEHQRYSFDALVQDLNRGNDFSRGPLFDAMLVMNHSEGAEAKKSTTDFDQAVAARSKFDFTIYFNVTPEKASFHMVYNIDLFEADDMQKFGDDLIRILNEMVRDESVTIKQVIDQITDEGELKERDSFESEMSISLDEDF